MEPYWTETIGEMEAQLLPDYDAMSPRDWSNVGEIIAGSSSYYEYDHRAERYDLPEWAAEAAAEGGAVLAIWFEDRGSNGAAVYPVSSLDDANGLYIVPAKAVAEEWSGTYAERLALAKEVATAEVATYSAYLQGDSCGWAVEWQGDVLDSVWGYIADEEYAKSEARSNATWWQDVLDFERARLEDAIEHAVDVAQGMADVRALRRLVAA